VTSSFWWGYLTALALAAAVQFTKYWRVSRDRLFVGFGLAFFLLGVNWAVLASTQPADEARNVAYLIRLVAFVVILAAIVDKNRRTS
jgi:hypothetical protein